MDTAGVVQSPVTQDLGYGVVPEVQDVEADLSLLDPGVVVHSPDKDRDGPREGTRYRDTRETRYPKGGRWRRPGATSRYWT